MSSDLNGQEGCFERLHTNKPQANALGAASMIIVTGGMNIAWSFELQLNHTLHLAICWFIAAIFGTLMGVVALPILSKKVIMLCSTSCVLLGGVLCLALYDNTAGLTAARYINGLGTGFTYVPMLTLAGEQSVKSLRGMHASFAEAMSFSLGIFLQSLCSNQLSEQDGGLSVAQIHGIICVVYGVLALLLVLLFSKESPVDLLLQNREMEAIDALRRLQNPQTINNGTFSWLHELKDYIAAELLLTLVQSAREGVPALLKLCLYRAMVALSYSWIVHYVLLQTTLVVETAHYAVILIIFSMLRWLGTLIATFSIDSLGRKNILLFSNLCAGGLVIAVGVCFDTLLNQYLPQQLTTIMAALVCFQFFAGLFVTPASTYLSEAFPLRVKPYYIGTCFSVEMLLQIIVCSCQQNFHETYYFYTYGALSLVFLGISFFALPETMQTTLLQAQQSFKNWRIN